MGLDFEQQTAGKLRAVNPEEEIMESRIREVPEALDRLESLLSTLEDKQNRFYLQIKPVVDTMPRPQKDSTVGENIKPETPDQSSNVAWRLNRMCERILRMRDDMSDVIERLQV